MTRPFTWYHRFLLSDLDLEIWPTFEKTLTLAITSIPWEVGLSYFTCIFLMTRPFTWYHNFYLVTLTLNFDLLVKIFNIGQNFNTMRGRAFTFQMNIPYGNTFHMAPSFLTLWPWPWTLTYFWKKVNLGCYLVMVAARLCRCFLTTLI